MTTPAEHITDLIHLDDHRTETGSAAINCAQVDVTWTYETPTERGESYVHVMRDLVEATHDRALRLHHDDELANIIRPLARMTTTDLNLFLEGVHDALQVVLDDLISARNRNQPSINWPAHVPGNGGPA